MKTSEATGSTIVEQVQGAASKQRAVETGVLHCLVASASQSRRNMLSGAASTAGWDTAVFAEPRHALAEFRKTLFQFALVDLDLRGRTPAGFRDLVRTLARDSSRILVGVCGHESDPAEEVWVRQLGIWLYLPGVTGSSEISLLCEQAKLVVEKQRSDQQAPLA